MTLDTLLTDEGFKDACNGAPMLDAARELQKQALLHINEGKRLKSRHSVPGGGP
ncbi:MAG TPA: hypothetical protein VFA48_02385 [Gammaproteobacteria bacterium]|nr:hypothetical protein [Gammaproteobacteria bacterium]